MDTHTHTHTRPKVLFLCSGAGGGDMGLHMAGFDVTGVDIEDHPSYPFELIVADALTVDLDGYDAYAASPPCQGYGRFRHRQDASKWPLLISPIRERLLATGKPFFIENVEDAAWDMKHPTRLCGSSFGLRIRRHRLIEASFPMTPIACEHEWQENHKPYRLYVGKSRTDGLGYRESGIQQVYGGNHNVGGNSHFMKSVAMGIDWMSEDDLNEAIPPAYTRYVGSHMMWAVMNSRWDGGMPGDRGWTV
jgi:DNA (cytosine-5)-methyltransferase 1